MKKALITQFVVLSKLYCYRKLFDYYRFAQLTLISLINCSDKFLMIVGKVLTIMVLRTVQ